MREAAGSAPADPREREALENGWYPRRVTPGATSTRRGRGRRRPLLADLGRRALHRRAPRGPHRAGLGTSERGRREVRRLREGRRIFGSINHDTYDPRERGVLRGVPRPAGRRSSWATRRSGRSPTRSARRPRPVQDGGRPERLRHEGLLWMEKSWTRPISGRPPRRPSRTSRRPSRTAATGRKYRWRGRPHILRAIAKHTTASTLPHGGRRLEQPREREAPLRRASSRHPVHRALPQQSAHRRAHVYYLRSWRSTTRRRGAPSTGPRGEHHPPHPDRGADAGRGVTGRRAARALALVALLFIASWDPPGLRGRPSTGLLLPPENDILSAATASGSRSSGRLPRGGGRPGAAGGAVLCSPMDIRRRGRGRRGDLPEGRGRRGHALHRVPGLRAAPTWSTEGTSGERIVVVEGPGRWAAGGPDPDAGGCRFVPIAAPAPLLVIAGSRDSTGRLRPPAEGFPLLVEVPPPVVIRRRN